MNNIISSSLGDSEEGSCGERYTYLGFMGAILEGTSKIPAENNQDASYFWDGS